MLHGLTNRGKIDGEIDTIGGYGMTNQTNEQLRGILDLTSGYLSMIQ